MQQHLPETNNEARLRDARAAEDIQRLEQQGELGRERVKNTAAARAAAADIVAQAANTDRNMLVEHDRIKKAKVDQLTEKKAKLEKTEEKYRGLINVAWMAFPVTAVVWVCTCTKVFLPDVMKERKRNTQRKMSDIDAELIHLTTINVRRDFSIGNTVSTTDTDRRYSGSADPAQQAASVYAPAPAYSSAPPTYRAHVISGAQVHIQ